MKPGWNSIKWRRWGAVAVGGALFGLLLAGLCYWQVTARPGELFDAVDAIPARRIGLVLGTSPTVGGRPNLYYRFRIEAAVALYRAGKVEKLLVSGDHGRPEYNEPDRMRTDLIAAGIPPEAVVADYAGFRTLDSVVRAKLVFGASEYTVISQRFHCDRALFIARHYGIDAIGFAARDVPWSFQLKMTLREIPARMAAWIDVKLWHRKPRYLGEPLPI